MCQRWLKIEAPQHFPVESLNGNILAQISGSQGELREPTAGAHSGSPRKAFSSEAIGEFNGVVGTFPALAPSAQTEGFGEKGRPWNSPITA